MVAPVFTFTCQFLRHLRQPLCRPLSHWPALTADEDTDSVLVQAGKAIATAGRPLEASASESCYGRLGPSDDTDSSRQSM